jgi:hypothetical protein
MSSQVAEARPISPEIREPRRRPLRRRSDRHALSGKRASKRNLEALITPGGLVDIALTELGGQLVSVENLPPKEG